VLEPGDDPLLCSHGAERGPIAIRYSDERAFQPPIVTWLSGVGRPAPGGQTTGTGSTPGSGAAFNGLRS
jgi:hypothetical protein